MKRALYLIIDRLRNVQKAIAFAQEQEDQDLWEDLLAYSMDKPRFIRGLLEQVGTSIDPIRLVRRIPEGLEIEGLREGLSHMMKEHEIQWSISLGVARVLRSEVAQKQNELRSGQRKGIKFDVCTPPVKQRDEEASEENKGDADGAVKVPAAQPGRCAHCQESFTICEDEALVGFACGHAFHVRHILKVKGARADAEFLAATDAEQFESGRHLVGWKVMRARLLRDKLRGGCPVCHVSHG